MRTFDITYVGRDGVKRTHTVAAKGKTSACHRFCGYRPTKALRLGLIESIKER